MYTEFARKAGKEWDEGIIEPRWTGTYAYRGMLDMRQAIEAVGEEQANVLPIVPMEIGIDFESSRLWLRQARHAQMYLGPDRHILTFPLQGNTRVNVVAFKTDRSKPVGDRTWNKALWVEDVSQDEMLADFDDWGDGVKRLLKVLPPNFRGKYKI
jgi:salicylate hydroxylase